jgi:hypothetical protein
MIRKIRRSCLGLFLLLRWRSAGASIQSTMLMLIVVLLAASPVPLSAATPDPVLEWIGVMNTAVIAGGTNPLATSRVVALVSASVFDAVIDLCINNAILIAKRGEVRLTDATPQLGRRLSDIIDRTDDVVHQLLNVMRATVR